MLEQWQKSIYHSYKLGVFMASITLFDVFIFAASWFFMILTSLMHESHKLQEARDLTV
jgi:hypothetical protein